MFYPYANRLQIFYAATIDTLPKICGHRGVIPRLQVSFFLTWCALYRQCHWPCFSQIRHYIKNPLNVGIYSNSYRSCNKPHHCATVCTFPRANKLEKSMPSEPISKDKPSSSPNYSGKAGASSRISMVSLLSH